jgi:hypothetical protein
VANGTQPACGGSSGGSTSFWIIVAIFSGGVSGVSGLISVLQWLKTPAGLPGPASEYLFTLFGLEVPTAVAAGAAAGAFGTFVIILYSAWNRLWPTKGIQVCYAGVINDIVEPFTSAVDYLFPFTAQHDRADVVIKPIYWNLVEAPPEQYIYCNDDSMTSPLIHTYYRTKKVAAAVAGSVYGGAVGAGVGLALGILAGAAIGCATVIFCVLALLIAAIVAIACVLAGAFAGGNIAAAATGNQGPSGTDPSNGGKKTLSVGDYISVNANLVVYPDDNSAWVAWWGEHTTDHGTSTSGEGIGGGAPFNFADPRDHLDPDACRVRTGGGSSSDGQPPPR